MNLRQILQRRESIRGELRSILEAHPDGALPAEAGARASTLEAEAAGLNDHERRIALIDELDRRSAGTPISGTGDNSFDRLASQVVITDVLRAQLGATDAGAGRAREVSAELERRSGRKAEGLFFHMGASGAPIERRVFSTTNPSGGPGSALIQTDISPNLIDRLRQRVICRQMGATVLGGLQGNLNIPRLKASATAYWVGESGAITASDPQTDDVSFTPKHVGGLVEVSRNMIQQPSIDVARMVEDDLLKLIAVALDQAAIQGGGSNQPVGILGTSGIGSVALGTNGAAPTWAAIIELIAAVDTANALTGSLGFVTNGYAVSAMRRTLKTSTDTASNFIMNAPNELAGYPLGSSQNVPFNLTKGTGSALAALIFGDWSQLVLGFWSELDILVNPYESTAYSKGNVQVRAMATADVNLRHAAAFAAIQDMVTT